jgi:predicted nucleic acid-binding protein
VTIVSRASVRTAVRERPARYGTELPGPIYCDTSALVTLYFAETGSNDLNRVLEGRDDLLVSDLAVTEAVSALARRWRDGSLTREAVSRVQRAILEGLETGVYERVELTRDVHRRAERLLVTAEVPLRAADALHVALATSRHAASLASFDARLGTAARATGLATYP